MTETVAQEREPTLQYLKLVTGDAIIADLQSVGDEWLLIRPLQVYIDNSRGRTELVIYPWLPTTSCDEKQVHIQKQHVLFHIPIISEVQIYLIEYGKKLYDAPRVGGVKDLGMSEEPTPAPSGKMSKEDVLKLLSNLPSSGKKN